MFYSESEVKVRYAETDAMAVVHHSSYIVWFELGRTDFIERIGYSYAGMEEQGFMLPVLDVHATYKKPLRYGDKAIVKTWIDEYDGLKLRFGYEIMDTENNVCVEGYTVHVIVRKETFRPVRLKNVFSELHEAFHKVMRTE